MRMNRLLSLRPGPGWLPVLLAYVILGLPAAHAATDPLENGVVKVFTTMRLPDPHKPWAKQAPSEITGSGVVIEGNRILTNAHVVLYASQVQVQANQAGDKLSASVVAIAPGIDLAVLKLDDPTFFKTHPPIPRASRLPEIKDAVLAYGYPTGGSALSITKGIVSRIEFVSYGYPTSGLRIQIDAAINPGNSGGPAIAGTQMIGLAFSHLGEAQNIGYIIPNEEIDLFLKDIADGRYDGKPGLRAELQTLENPALRDFLHLDRSVSGIIVRRDYRTDQPGGLKQWDVITRIADTPIDDQGMIKLGDNLRVSFLYLVQTVAKDDRVPLTVVRSGKVVSLQVPAARDAPLLIPDTKGAYPPYFIYGPLVFSAANSTFAASMTGNAQLAALLSFLGSPLVTRRGDAPTADRQELVVVTSPFFPHKVAKGYGNPGGSVVYSVNGIRIKSLKHLVETLRDLKDEYVILEFEHRESEVLVFPRKELVASTEEILTDNGVRAQASPELLAVWSGAPAK